MEMSKNPLEGKWYSFNWDWHGPNSTIIAKIKEVYEDSFSISWRNYLWREKGYGTSDGYDFRKVSNIKELSLEEVQQYLPENHPDKFKTVQSFEVGKWYKTVQSFEVDKWFKKDGYIFFKLLECTDSDKLWGKEWIIDGKYKSDDHSSWIMNTNTKEISLQEIQQYLPDEHPDKFSNFNTSKYKMRDEEKAKAQFVTLDEAFVLPEKWCIKSNKDIDQILCKWRGGTHSLPPEENILTYQRYWVHVKYIEDFTEITFEQFKKYVLKEPEKMENASKDNLITRAVKTNNPQLIADELGYSIEEIIKSENSTINSCAGNNFELLGDDISCYGLSCTDDKCPFYNSNEEVISWLKSGSKSVSPPESELERWLRETKAKNLSLGELEDEINYKCSSEVYDKLQGNWVRDKAQILYNEWNVKQERDWTKATKEELLEDANRRYPKGTKFRSVASNDIYVSDGNAISWPSSSYPDGIANYLGLGLFYASGNWAEIISEGDSPNVEATSCAETDKTIDFNFLPDPD